MENVINMSNGAGQKEPEMKIASEQTADFIVVDLKGMEGVKLYKRIAQAIQDHSKLDEAGLEASFRQNGFHPSPLDTWRNPADKKLYLLDGFRRIAICLKLGLPLPPGKMVNGIPDLEAAIQYRIDKHLNRRNMSPMWIAYLWGSKYNSIKKSPHRPNAADNSLNGKKEAPQNEVDTSRKLAIDAGVGHATIDRYAQFAKNVDLLKEAISQEFARGLLDKKYKLSKGDIIKLANMPEAERKAIAEALISNPKWTLSEAEQSIHPPTQVTTSAKSNPNFNNDQGNNGGNDGDGDPSDDNLNGEGNPQSGGSSNSNPDESDRILQTFNSRLSGYWATIQNMDRVSHPENLPNLIKTLKDITEQLEKIEANSRSV